LGVLSTEQTMKEKTAYYESLMAAYFSGEATPEEIRQLSAWIAEERVNLELFEASHKVWLLAGKDATDSAIDLDAEWAALTTRMGETTTSPPLTHKAGNSRILKMFSSWKAAAAIVILMVAATAYFYLNTGPDIIVITADSGNREQVLPDGTAVTLLRGSEIEYPAEFTDLKREVKLEGEAYFEVRRDEMKPFIVSGSNARIEVLGTSFNVNTRAGKDKVSVVLTSGKVSLYFKGRESENIILHPGEEAEMILSKKAITTGSNPDPNYMAWKTGKIIFDNTSLVQVIATLSKVYQAEIRLGNPQLSGCSLTATFEKQPLASVLNVIKATLDVEIKNEGGILIITGSTCN